MRFQNAYCNLTEKKTEGYKDVENTIEKYSNVGLQRFAGIYQSKLLII